MAEQAEVTTKQLNRRTIRRIVRVTEAISDRGFSERALRIAEVSLGVANHADVEDLVAAVFLPNDRAASIDRIIELSAEDPLDVAIDVLALERDGIKRVASLLAAVTGDESLNRLPQSNAKAARRVAGVLLGLGDSELGHLREAAALIRGEVSVQESDEHQTQPEDNVEDTENADSAEFFDLGAVSSDSEL